MARRKDEGLLSTVAGLAWPVGIVLGIAAFLGVRYGAAALLGASGNPFLVPIGRQLAASGSLAWVAWLLLAVCWLGALLSFLQRGKRQRLLESQSGLESLRAMSWQEFELLVGEAFRRRGFVVQESGLGGADGGVDLILGKGGKTTLVQCKQWRRQRVDVRVVREMYGLLAHHQAQAAIIVCVGDFTPDARRFSAGKPIELIHGEALLAMVRAVQTAQPPTKQSTAATGKVQISGTASPEHDEAKLPACPKCGSTMVERANRRNGEKFWGCSKYPACRGTRQKA